MPVRETANGFIPTLPYQLGTGGGIMRSLSLIKLNYLLLCVATKTFAFSLEYKTHCGLLPATATGYLELTRVAKSLPWQEYKHIKFCKPFLLKHVPLKRGPWRGSTTVSAVTAHSIGKYAQCAGQARAEPNRRASSWGFSEASTFFNRDSMLINITSHKPDVAAAEIVQHEEEKKECKT